MSAQSTSSPHPPNQSGTSSSITNYEFFFTPNGRKRRRITDHLISSVREDSQHPNNGVNEFNNSTTSKRLLSTARLHWARYFNFGDVKDVDKVLKEAMGKDIFLPGNAYAYDLAYTKVRSLGRQWQCQTIKRLTEHVEREYQKDKDILDYLNPTGIRNYFARGLNNTVMQEVFHVLNPDVDTAVIIGSAVDGLYTTFFAETCKDIFLHRVQAQAQAQAREREEEDPVFENFKAYAYDPGFEDITIVDIPLQPRKIGKAMRKYSAKKKLDFGGRLRIITTVSAPLEPMLRRRRELEVNLAREADVAGDVAGDVADDVADDVTGDI
ncbi:hypothetical protein BZA77DRAFT_295123 [Pyronema omphalodes]|nr:hypothetical protein BZA77DRAFT_295123 [Pyronema omphalodes]